MTNSPPKSGKLSISESPLTEQEQSQRYSEFLDLHYQMLSQASTLPEELSPSFGRTGANLEAKKGLRCLAIIKGKQSYVPPQVHEVYIIEISPSGNYIKFMNEHGNKMWRMIEEFNVIEELKPLERPKTDGS